MDGNTPVTLATARYSDRDSAVNDYITVWDARGDRELSHRRRRAHQGRLRQPQVERHDRTAKHLAWGVAVLGAAGGPERSLATSTTTSPKGDVEAAGELLQSSQSGLIVVAVNRRGEDIAPLLKNADKTQVTNTTWGDLDAEIENEIANAQTNPTST